MKFRLVKKLFKTAAVLGMIALVMQAPKAVGSFWFEGGQITEQGKGVLDFIDSVEKTTEKLKSAEDAEDFAKIIADLANGVANENDAEFVKAKVVRVVDGDTIVVDIDREEVKVRLIGVNTPESVASAEYLEKTGKENTAEGKDASDFTKDILKNYPYVYLEADKGAKDLYGRSLYYVWLEKPIDTPTMEDIEDKMLNGILLKEKIAEVSIFKPNTKYADEFAAIYSDTTDLAEVDR